VLSLLLKKEYHKKDEMSRTFHTNVVGADPMWNAISLFVGNPTGAPNRPWIAFGRDKDFLAFYPSFAPTPPLRLALLYNAGKCFFLFGVKFHVIPRPIGV
jgi:hypothetical protein